MAPAPTPLTIYQCPLLTSLRFGAGNDTIRDIAGHVSKQMLKHYSHIRMDAKRRAPFLDAGRSWRRNSRH